MASNGETTFFGCRFDDESADGEARRPRPNGIALRRDGSFLFADLGESQGGVFQMCRDGAVRDLLTRVDGIDLPPTNFVVEDDQERIWITVSTRKIPRAAAYRRDVADGFIVLKDARGARIVADGLGFTNEALVSPDGGWLYVNETFHRKLTRFPIATDGSLGRPEVVAEFGPGQFPDGMAFDDRGGVWIACVVGNQLIRVDRDGEQQVILKDSDVEYVHWVEDAYLASQLDRQHLDRPHRTTLKNISSVAFGGADLRTVYLGCLLGDSVASFRIPSEIDLRGLPPVHWEY